MTETTIAPAPADTNALARGPITSTGYLALASEHIRQAAEAPAPATPHEVYDQLGALFEIAYRLDQHMQRCAEALTAVAGSPLLRAHDDDPDPAFTARTAVFRLSATAAERLAGLVAEVNTTWTEVSALYLADTPAASAVCCEQHTDPCCDPDDCGPCCPACPTCPTLHLAAGPAVETVESAR